MDKMLYVAMSGASQNSLAQRAHANNLANISTSGFRRDFEQARSMPVFGDSFPSRVYAMTERPGTDFTPGALQETGRDLDVAIERLTGLLPDLRRDERPGIEGLVARYREERGAEDPVIAALFERIDGTGFERRLAAYVEKHTGVRLAKLKPRPPED